MPPGLALTQGPAKYHVGKPKNNKNSAFFSGCKSRANWNDFITTEKNREITKIERVFENIAHCRRILLEASTEVFMCQRIFMRFIDRTNRSHRRLALIRFYNFRRNGNTILNVNTIHTHRWRQRGGGEAKHNRNNNNLRAHNWPENETKD